MKLTGTFFLILLSVAGCTNRDTGEWIPSTGHENKLYSQDGQEHVVRFQALYRSKYHRLDEISQEAAASNIKATSAFLFGPLTNRQLAGIQKGEQIEPLVDQAYLQGDQVMIPYRYRGTWLIGKEAFRQGSLELPVPYSIEDLRTPQWKNCTDSEADHSTWGFFWYFWDPERSGCDHKLGQQYQNITVQIGAETAQTRVSYPEYKRLLRDENGQPTLAMTFAFGYVAEVTNPNPFRDSDYGMVQFQSFYSDVKKRLLPLGFTEQTLHQKDITSGSGLIGSQFVGFKDGAKVRVSVVAAAGVDQMDLFADSYAAKHEGFFGWFGHSRVGSGFDADNLVAKLSSQPRQFSISSDYQLVYWGGCNSYSYYTQPFFRLKSDLNPQGDANGTRNLDLISNALPSLFSFNAYNASVMFEALMSWQSPTSYQEIVNQIEGFARTSGEEVLVNVLGDEDNP